jgi:hypothetical protein
VNSAKFPLNFCHAGKRTGRVSTRLLPLLFFFVLGFQATAQTVIWSEDFSYSNFTIIGNGSPAITTWTTDGFGNYFLGTYVYQNQLNGYLTKYYGYTTWEISSTDPIEISSYQNVSVTMDLSKTGQLEGDDYIQVQYKVDNGTWTDFPTNGYISDDFRSCKASVSGLSGASLFLRIVMDNGYYDGHTEDYWVDNIIVTGELPSTAPDCTNPVDPLDGQSDIPLNKGLSWNAAAQTTGYYLYFGTNNPPSSIEDGTSITSTNYSPAADLEPNTTYYWQVVPYNSYGSASSCDVWSFTTGATAVEDTVVKQLFNEGKNLVFNFPFDKCAIISDGILIVTIQGDINERNEFYYINDENGRIGQIGPTNSDPNNDCDFTTKVYTIPQADMQALAADNTLTFIADPSDGVNESCPSDDPSYVEMSLQYSYAVLPSCSISTPSPVCANEQDIVISGPERMYNYAWSITSGDAVIDGASDSNTVLVDAGSNDFTISLTIESYPGCSATCSKTITVNTVPSAPVGETTQNFCNMTTPTVANLVATGTNIQWYNVATGGTPLDDTELLTDGTYYASQTMDGCESNDRLAITVTVGEVTVTCPSNTSYDCYSGLPVIADFGDLVDAGGSYTNTCGELTDLSLEVKDVIVPSTSSASGNCEVERTFTVTDGTTALDSCTQIITLTGTTPPSFRDADGSDYLPAYTSTTPGCVQEIPLPDFEGSCSGVTYSVTQVSGTTVSDLAIDTDAKVLTGTFPAGTYTLEWTIDDVCGYGTATANQLVEVTQPEITYDGFALDELPDGVGSGVKPMSSSTHTYTVDGATASDGYTYRWTITKDSDASVAYATGSGNSETNISVEFTAADYDQGSYTIEVIKSNGSCSVTLERSIEVQINSFDASVTGENSLCQSGETSTATQIKWTVTFPAIDSEPFDFNYTITLNGSTACTGSVSEITYTSSSFDHDSGCAPSGSSATPPFIEIDKSADSYELTVSYTVPNQTATDFDYGIQITASDKYAVSDPEVENDSFSTTAHGVPATSAITTD